MIPHDDAVMFGPFRLDSRTESVWRDADEIRLRPKTFALLRYLVERPGALVTKEALLAAIWPEVAVGEVALAVCVGEIRKALGDDARTPRFVETVHRRGYRFIGNAHAPAAEAEPGAERPRTNVPRQLTSFIGREREMSRVKATLAASALVTLTGAGGVGKTRVAMQIAAAVLADFQHGAWLVDLAPLTDPGDVPHAVASALGVREQAGRPVRAVLLDYLRPKRLLLVLDNCEHLLGAAAELGESLLRDCPGLRILATSREGLGVAGEALQVIPPLDVPAAIRLFIERAAVLAPDFTLTDRNERAVTEVCRRLDGIPLAIELAAARVTSMAVEEIAARLDDRFRLLTGGGRTALPRHQTLRGVLDWSHQLLADAERVLLRRLSAFAGGFTLAAAERACAGGELAERDVADLLARLVARSLVVFDRTAAEPRYRMLETIRQYAQAKLLDSGESDAVRAGHLDHYLAFAETAGAFLRGPEQMTWIARLGAEHDNLRAALGWSLGRADLADAAMRLASALQWFWFLRGPVDEGRQWLHRALSSPAASPAVTRASALAGLGMLAWRADDFTQARTALEESLALARALDEESTLGFALHHLAHVTLMVEGLPEAVRMFEESVSRFRTCGDTWGTAWSLRCLGDNLRGQGTTAQAVSRLEESLALFRKTGDRWLMGHVLFSLGAIAEEQADHARANALLEESVAVWREAEDHYDVAVAHRELGNVACGQGQLDRAAALYAASLAAFREMGDRYETGRLLECLAALALDRGDARRAAQMLGVADALRLAIGATVRSVDRARHERTIAAARATLGGEAFDVAVSEGRGMAVDDALGFVLDRR